MPGDRQPFGQGDDTEHGKSEDGQKEDAGKAKLRPLLFGGHQQQGRRPGTEPVALAVGLATALGLAKRDLETRRAKVVALRRRFLDALRTIAASRLLLDNFPHIEAYWVMIGEATASLALHFGASDVNGTLEDEKIAHMAQAASPAGLATEQILRMVRDAGKVAVERDALYKVVKVWS